ncbi:hypothetical protein BLNAU_1986 [Blattamonas nauphoetae]|uniref:Uncharacterized protein n=1 Tax=Blattamonas nauphoetae TaxID=2049346 RepID=A0ABQ9YGW3_9EUKA|nr:hypothetical protein BLNAU_1986 [Blattamonas nauphoetae]
MGFNPQASFKKNYLKAQKLIQQATIGYPYFFNQWTIFSIEKELDDMVEAERMKMNDDPMQGLGMNDGDKGGGTAGAQAKLETTKMILLAVLNLLDQPSSSVDRLHRLALLAARKAKETFEYIKKQLLISPNTEALWKMMRTVVIDLLNDDTVKDGLDSIITILEKKATTKKANEHQSPTKQSQILKQTSQMSAVVLTYDLFEHLAAPTLDTKTALFSQSGLAQSVVSERQKRVQEGRGLHCGVPQSVACVALLVDNRVPWAVGHDRRLNIHNLRIVVAAGESDCLHRRRRTRIAVAEDCVSGHGVPSYLGCGAKCIDSAGCVPDAAAGVQQLVHTLLESRLEGHVTLDDRHRRSARDDQISSEVFGDAEPDRSHGDARLLPAKRERRRGDEFGECCGRAQRSPEKSENEQLTWLVSNTEQLITLPAAELTPNRHAT